MSAQDHFVVEIRITQVDHKVTVGTILPPQGQTKERALTEVLHVVASRPTVGAAMNLSRSLLDAYAESMDTETDTKE